MNMYCDIPALKDRQTSVRKFLNNQIFRIVLGCVAVIFAVLCSLNMSVMSTKGYDIAELEDQISALEKANQKIDLKIAEYRSMRNIQGRLDDSLIAAEDIKYATLVGTAVARR